MIIDNFDLISSHLTFEDEFDRYVINILRRTKDIDDNNLGSNECQRLIRTYYIGDLDYLQRKIPAIKELCFVNKARAYILPQVRNNRECLINLGKMVFENLDNPTIKLDSIVRKAVCSLHSSRAKRWIIDYDFDNNIEYKTVIGFPRDSIMKTKWTSEMVLEFIKNQLSNIGKSSDEAYMIPTVHGKCIITSPFNLQKAYEQCNMLFQGNKKIAVDNNGTIKEINGWLIKDGMALLYYNDEK